MKTIVTNIKNGNRYVLLHFLNVNEYYLIPYDGYKYWEHHFVPRESWILLDNYFDFSEFDNSKEWFDNYINEGMSKYNEITKNYHDKFK